MLTFNEAQVWAWLSPVIWPFIRVLALIGAMPIFAQRSVPTRVKVALSFFIALSAGAVLPEMPVVPLDSPQALMLVAQQVLIGLSMAFAVRLIFAAVEFAGEIGGLQMGLTFAGFFDPASGGQTTALSRFFGMVISWMFIVINGHLLMISAVVQSFHAFPVSTEPFAFLRATRPELWGAEMFSLGLWIALPLIAMLLFTNLVLGVIARVAQQMNIFAIGFPITLSVGLIGVLLTLPLMEMPFTAALERMLAMFQ
jgi:flagellar biosynthetic protein FliR